MPSIGLRLLCFVLVPRIRSTCYYPILKVSKHSKLNAAALTNQEDDEVLFAIAEELGKIWELHSDKTLYIPLLEKLAKSEETVVREQAARSLISICEVLSDAEIQNVFTPMVIRLAQAEWFTGRVSSCSLFYHAYPHSGA